MSERWMVEVTRSRVSEIEVEADDAEGALEQARLYSIDAYAPGFICETSSEDDVSMYVGDPLD